MDNGTAQQRNRRLNENSTNGASDNPEACLRDRGGKKREMPAGQPGIKSKNQEQKATVDRSPEIGQKNDNPEKEIARKNNGNRLGDRLHKKTLGSL